MTQFDVFLVFTILLCNSTPASLLLFLVTSLYLSYVLILKCLLLGLLTLVVYLGALIVLFAYIWIYITFDKPVWYGPPLICCFILFSFSVKVGIPSSLLPLVVPSAFLLFLVGVLFWAIVVVVLILDLSLGGFSS